MTDAELIGKHGYSIWCGRAVVGPSAGHVDDRREPQHGNMNQLLSSATLS